MSEWEQELRNSETWARMKGESQATARMIWDEGDYEYQGKKDGEEMKDF